MKKIILLLTAALPVVLSSCSTELPPQAFRNTDNTALIIQSLDVKSYEVIAPTAIAHVDNASLLAKAKTFPQHQTAVVILENYSEPRLGTEFRDRSVDLFVGLRSLGYQHIIFVKGNGVTDPNGLATLAEYD